MKGYTKCLTLASVYGISGASSDERKKNLNEDILQQAIQRAIKADKTPYLLCGDFNIDPGDSPAIASAVDKGLLIDVGHAWATETDDDKENPGKIPENTFYAEGPTPGIQGKGATRIDAILANPVMATAIKRFTPRWDLVEEAHVPLQIEVCMEQLNGEEVKQTTRGNVKCDIDAEESEVDTNDAYEKANKKYNDVLYQQIRDKDLNGAHETWNKAAEMCTMIVQGKTEEEAFNAIEAT